MTYNDERPHPHLYDGPDDDLELDADERDHSWVSDHDARLGSQRDGDAWENWFYSNGGAA